MIFSKCWITFPVYLIRFNVTARHLICLLLFAAANLVSAEEFIIGVNDSYATSVGKERVTQLFEVMYKPLGITPSVQYYPSKRGLRFANRGEIDAEAGRVLSVAEEYAELIVIPEPMIKHDVGYFCLVKANCKRSNEIIYGLTTGFVAGQKYCDNNQFRCISNQGAGFSVTMLANGAIDALIGSLTSTANAICKSKIERAYYRSEKQLEIASFHLINKRHKEKVTALKASIKAMHERGDFVRFVAENSQLDPNCNAELVKL